MQHLISFLITPSTSDLVSHKLLLFQDNTLYTYHWEQLEQPKGQQLTIFQLTQVKQYIVTMTQQIRELFVKMLVPLSTLHSDILYQEKLILTQQLQVPSQLLLEYPSFLQSTMMQEHKSLRQFSMLTLLVSQQMWKPANNFWTQLDITTLDHAKQEMLRLFLTTMIKLYHQLPMPCQDF